MTRFRLFPVFLSLFFLLSCASATKQPGKTVEYAIATQHVGEQYYNSGNYTMALQKLLEAYEAIPDDPYINNSLGLVYLKKERYNIAVEYFKKALALKVDYIEAKNNLGAAYIKQENWDKAIPIFKSVADDLLYTTPEIPLFNLGWAYFQKKDYAKAKAYFHQSLNKRPGFLYAIHGISSVYMETGYYTLAIDYIKDMLKNYPDAAILHADLADAYEAVRQMDSAKKSWQTVIDLEPETSPLARKARKKLAELR